MKEQFKAIIGHKKVLERLSLRIGKYSAGVYLFYGPVSVGKRTVAREIARYILCLEKSIIECQCYSCKRFIIDHPDLIEIGGDGKIKVADIDRVIDFCTTTPFISNTKIIIIDDAHDISVEAANRLLKLLEEPPLNYCFFLISSNPQLIIPTITSRCIKYGFDNLSKAEFIDVIRNKLGFNLKEAEILSLLATYSSIDVLKNAGQCITYRNMAIEFLSGIKDRPLIDSLDYIDKVPKDDISVFNDMVTVILTDLILVKNNFLDITNIDQSNKIKKIAEYYNDRALIAIVNVFSQLKRYLYLNINLNLYFKNALIKTYPFFMVKE